MIDHIPIAIDGYPRRVRKVIAFASPSSSLVYAQSRAIPDIKDQQGAVVRFRTHTLGHLSSDFYLGSDAACHRALGIAFPTKKVA